MTHQNTRFHSCHPAFVVRDLEAATRFYEDVIGLKKLWSWGEPVMRIGLGPADDSSPPGFELNLINNRSLGPSGTSFVYFTVSGVEAIYKRCLDKEADIYLELGDRDWGMRDFRVSDPDGNRLGFGEALPNPTSA